MNESIPKEHCCQIVSVMAKMAFLFFCIALFVGLVQSSITRDEAIQSRKAAVLAYANKLGLSKDIAANFKCINNQVHYVTNAQLFGNNYALMQPIVTCDSEYYKQSTHFEASESILKWSGWLFLLALVLSLIRLNIDPELKAYQERKKAEKGATK
jgi:hypothetical protein